MMETMYFFSREKCETELTGSSDPKIMLCNPRQPIVQSAPPLHEGGALSHLFAMRARV